MKNNILYIIPSHEHYLSWNISRKCMTPSTLDIINLDQSI